jgi:hypothetical protein
MNKPPTALGQLVKVELREAWASEAGDFTPWLAQEKNLRLLGDTIELELELEAQEKDVGPFRADILCKDTASGQRVLIENQLERTDHTHLGQLMTYAAGLEAVTIVWIAHSFTDEHRAALDWLNERTDEKVNLFGLEVELWRIGDSPPAPKFNVVCKPNDWSRTIKGPTQGAVSALKLLQQQYWAAFRKHMEEKGSGVRCQAPLAQNWTNHALGRTGIYLVSVVSTWDKDGQPEIRTEVVFNGPNAKQEFTAVEAQRGVIEKALSFELTWYNPTDVKQSKAYARAAFDFREQQQWPDQFEWLRSHLEAMNRVFRPIVKNLPVGQSPGEGAE